MINIQSKFNYWFRCRFRKESNFEYLSDRIRCQRSW